MDAIVDQLILGRFLADPDRLLTDSGRSWQIPKFETWCFALGLSGGRELRNARGSKTVEFLY